MAELNDRCWCPCWRPCSVVSFFAQSSVCIEQKFSNKLSNEYKRWKPAFVSLLVDHTHGPVKMREKFDFPVSVFLKIFFKLQVKAASILSRKILKTSVHSKWNENVFHPHYTRKKCKIAIITGQFGFLDSFVTKIWSGKWLSRLHRCREAPFWNVFCPNEKEKSFRFEERFRKVPFLWEISVDGMPDCRNKAAFSNFCHFAVFLSNCTQWKFCMYIFVTKMFLLK